MDGSGWPVKGTSSEGLKGEEANHFDLEEECLDRGNLEVESGLINKKATVAEVELG